ncbi:MAG: hypothetical protein KatS3mg031_2049 [Chitinophagales bacterium]|nr:MAG: hypothetical protein KatS3mg031_2049 [Chitinophagales bacterium]
MYPAILHTHSVVRYVLLLLLVIIVIRGIIGYSLKKPYRAIDNSFSLAVLITAHVQLLLGLILYAISPVIKSALSDFSKAMGDDTLRFWAVEHVTLMLVAIAFITVGRVWAKKASLDRTRFRRELIAYSFALIAVVAGVPWERWIP